MSRAWRRFGWLLGGSAAFLFFGSAFGEEDLQGWYTHFTAPVKNPVGLGSNGGDGPWLVIIVILLAAVVAEFASVAALFYRFARATGDQRQQLKWARDAAGVTAFFGLVGVVGSMGLRDPVSVIFHTLFIISVGVGIPLAVGVAVFKYHLYDLDFVVRKSIVLGVLAAFITAVYVGIVVALGSTIKKGSDNSLLVYSAAAVVAVGFQPIRARAARFADKLVYGKRATPYDVFSDLAHRMSGSYSVQEVLPTIVQALASATGALETGVWLRSGNQLHLSATWPPNESGTLKVVPVDGPGLPRLSRLGSRLPRRASGRAARSDHAGAATQRSNGPGEGAAHPGSGRSGRAGPSQRRPVRGPQGLPPAAGCRAGRRAPAAGTQHPRRRAAAAAQPVHGTGARPRAGGRPGAVRGAGPRRRGTGRRVERAPRARSRDVPRDPDRRRARAGPRVARPAGQRPRPDRVCALWQTLATGGGDRLLRGVRGTGQRGQARHGFPQGTLEGLVYEDRGSIP